MKINVLQIENNDAFFIKSETLSEYKCFLLNEKEISTEMKKHDIVMSSKDMLQYVSSSKKLVEYRRNEETMTVSEFDSKPQGYDEDSSEEEVLRAIANRKELKGFEPYYEDVLPQDVELNVVGHIKNTCSKFISCSLKRRYDDTPVIYKVDVLKVAMDEYLTLRTKHASHAKFAKPDRGYLEFVQINNSYCFEDCYPFGDWNYKRIYSNLKEAQNEEENIRECVRSVVNNAVFKVDFTKIKAMNVLNQLSLVKK